MAAMGAQGAAEWGGVVGGQGYGGGSQLQPAPLAFDVREIERFRYRVEDTLKKVNVVVSRLLRSYGATLAVIPRVKIINVHTYRHGRYCRTPLYTPVAEY